MTNYLIDVNLPDRFSLWHTQDYQYVSGLDAHWDDRTIWEYARQKNMTIVTKDRDFYDRILVSTPPPSVIYIRCGNLRIRALYELMHRVWVESCELSQSNKLVMIYPDRLEAIA